MLHPPSTKTHWIYDDPSGVPDLPLAATQAVAPRGKAKVLPLPVRPVPATPKAA